MPSLKIAGKSKDDLVTIAQIAGLLSAEEARSMTKVKLVQFLEQENARSEAAQTDTAVGNETPAAVTPLPQAETDETESETPAVQKISTGSRRAKSNPSVAEAAAPQTETIVADQTAGAQSDPAESPKKTKTTKNKRPGRPRKTRKTAAQTAEPQKDTLAESSAGDTPDTSDVKPVRRRRKTAAAAEQSTPIEALAEQNAEQTLAQSATSDRPTEMTPDAATPVSTVKKRRPGRPRRKAATVEPEPADAVAGTKTAKSVKPDTDRTDANEGETGRAAAADQQDLTRPAAVQPAEGMADADPDAQEAGEEQSPEATEAASEREEKSDHRKSLKPGFAGRTPAVFPGSMNRIPRSRITTRQIRPTDHPADQNEADSQETASDAATGQAAGEQKPATVERLPEAVAAKETESDKETANVQADKQDIATAASDSVKDKKPVVESSDIQGGVLEIMPDGYGFLRKDNYLQGNKDIYVPPQYIRRFGLRAGDFVNGPVRLQRENDRYQALLYIKDVNGLPPEKMIRRPHFDRLTPIHPNERFVLETARNELSTRIIDLVAPIGKGQRGMIVSPPKAGKTILLQKIANAVSINNPDTKLIVLLIDERPEEVTEMQRSINGEVVYSTFDKTPENHTKVVELVLERAMRLVELKQDVMILLDSMTRLARAYNLTINPTGRTLSGGLDPGALYGPKRFFGAARNIENGGSLTIIATSLIETGSRMDEVIFEEFKGTGNMEVHLDRKLSEKRIFPAIDLNKSGTRREELLMNNRELDAVWTIRKAFGQLDTAAVTEAIINLLLKTKNNEHFISSVNISFNDKNVFEAMRGTRPGSQQANTGTNGGYNSGGSYNSAGYGSNYRRHNVASNNDDD